MHEYFPFLMESTLICAQMDENDYANKQGELKALEKVVCTTGAGGEHDCLTWYSLFTL